MPTTVKLANMNTQSQAQSTLSTGTLQYQEDTYTEIYIVNFDEPDNAYDAMQASGIPAVGAEFGSTGLYATKVLARPNGETSRSFIVQVDYSDQVEQNPLDLPAAITWDFDDATEPYFIDNSATPKPCVNSAGEPFETMLEREAGKIKATVVKNQSSYDPTQAVTYNEVVNSDSFTIDGVSISEGQAKCKAITAGPTQTVRIDESDVSYRAVTYTLHFRSSWLDKIEDRGYHESNGAGKLKEIIKGTPPIKPDKPWPLNGAGAAKPNATDVPAQLTFQPYKTQAFSTIAGNFV